MGDLAGLVEVVRTRTLGGGHHGHQIGMVRFAEGYAGQFPPLYALLLEGLVLGEPLLQLVALQFLVLGLQSLCALQQCLEGQFVLISVLTFLIPLSPVPQSKVQEVAGGM